MGGIRTTTAVTMASIAGDVGTLVTEVISWTTEYLTLITGNPLLMMFVVFAFIGTGIGVIKRLVRL